MKQNDIIDIYKNIYNKIENDSVKSLFQKKIELLCSHFSDFYLEDELRYISGILAHVPLCDEDFKILKSLYSDIANTQIKDYELKEIKNEIIR